LAVFSFSLKRDYSGDVMAYRMGEDSGWMHWTW